MFKYCIVDYEVYFFLLKFYNIDFFIFYLILIDYFELGVFFIWKFGNIGESEM